MSACVTKRTLHVFPHPAQARIAGMNCGCSAVSTEALAASLGLETEPHVELRVDLIDVVGVETIWIDDIVRIAE